MSAAQKRNAFTTKHTKQIEKSSERGAGAQRAADFHLFAFLQRIPALCSIGQHDGARTAYARCSESLSSASVRSRATHATLSAAVHLSTPPRYAQDERRTRITLRSVMPVLPRFERCENQCIYSIFFIEGGYVCVEAVYLSKRFGQANEGSIVSPSRCRSTAWEMDFRGRPSFHFRRLRIPSPLMSEPQPLPSLSLCKLACAPSQSRRTYP